MYVGSSYVKRDRVDAYFQRFNSVAEALRTALPGFFADLSDQHSWPDSVGDVLGVRLSDLIREIEYCLRILNSLDLNEHGIALRVTREGAFFAGQQFDAV